MWDSLSPMYHFLIIMGYAFLMLLICLAFGGVMWLLTRNIPDPEPKGKTIDMTGYKRYDKNGKLY